MAHTPVEILLVDDDPLCRSSLEAALAEPYRVHSFSSPSLAEELLSKNRNIAVVVLDLNMGATNGIDVLNHWKKLFPDIEYIFCSGEERVDRAIECIRQGASDFIVKPFHREDLLLTVARAVERRQIRQQVENLKPLLLPQPIEFIGNAPQIRDLLDKATLLKKQTHLNVLILGESGTGKEILARRIHQQEDSPQRPFVVANMPAIPSSLMEAELFGVEKGAFTDAKVSRCGKFELANGGDLFLDEIGDLPMETQAKMLRALQEKQVERVGSSRTLNITFRAISATNQPLADLMSNGRFREDLIYRLSDLVLWLPPLRERLSDIPALVEHFIQKYSPRGKRTSLAASAMETLMRYQWPGNIRQLESTIKRALIFNRGTVIDTIEIFDPSMLKPVRPEFLSDSNLQGSYEDQIAQFEKSLIEKTLLKNGGSKQQTMDELKLSRATFYRKLSQFQIEIQTH